MREVTLEQVKDCLDFLGLRPGMGLLVHSAIQFLGRPVGGPGLYFQALQHALDLPRAGRLAGRGTLAVPTFNFAFARGEPYSPEKTPSSGMGVGELSVHFRNSHIHSALFCDVGERLISSTWEHIDASLRTAREGDVKMAKLHIDLANNAFKEAARYLPAPLYASFSQDVKKALEQINS